MKSLARLILFIIAPILLLSSCSKDKPLENITAQITPHAQYPGDTEPQTMIYAPSLKHEFGKKIIVGTMQTMSSQEKAERELLFHTITFEFPDTVNFTVRKYKLGDYVYLNGYDGMAALDSYLYPLGYAWPWSTHNRQSPNSPLIAEGEVNITDISNGELSGTFTFLAKKLDVAMNNTTEYIWVSGSLSNVPLQ